MNAYIVDSFTNQAFKGNPAGVCLVEKELPDHQMQAIARELNFSETAFVAAQGSPNEFSIRYFSPVMEIPLCGHATLASSKVIFKRQPGIEHIRFRTSQDLELYITQADQKIVMEFPVYDVDPASVPDALLKAIGINQIVNCVHNAETNIILLEIESTEDLRRLTPDFVRMKSSYDGIHGVLVTAKSSDDDFDFHSRFFWPWSGGDEDPVTGGTHTFMAKYWSERLEKKRMRSFQSSSRTGSMEVELTENNKLLIKAEAVILFEGEWVEEWIDEPTS